ncbi:MAG: hypothetical protein UU11_C0002G0124 [Parcubacteria group bacterium GW2011_GWF2_40_69]|nr:MAG: hypothetical protein UU11_C0002G0124 [Parcubacteria group bacterium GW2011_GWF2_40_69]
MLKKIFNIIVYIFAIIGLFLTAGFFAVKYGATDTTGIIDSQQANFIEGAGVVTEPGTSTGPYYWSTLPNIERQSRNIQSFGHGRCLP